MAAFMAAHSRVAARRMEDALLRRMPDSGAYAALMHSHRQLSRNPMRLPSILRMSRPRAAAGRNTMPLLTLHHGTVRSLARKHYLSLSRVLKRIGATLGLLHRAIVGAKRRRGRNEFLFRGDYGEMLSPEHDMTKRPQRPLILGNKWDF